MIFLDDSIGNPDSERIGGVFPLERSDISPYVWDAERTERGEYEALQWNDYSERMNAELQSKNLPITFPKDAVMRQLNVTPPNINLPSGREDIQARANRIGLGTRRAVKEREELDRLNDPAAMRDWDQYVYAERETNPDTPLKTIAEIQKEIVDETKRIRTKAEVMEAHGSGIGNFTSRATSGLWFSIGEPENVAAIAASLALGPAVGGSVGAQTGAGIVTRLGPRLFTYATEAALGGAAEWQIAEGKEAFRKRLGMTQEQIDALQIEEAAIAAGGAVLLGALFDGAVASVRRGARWVRGGPDADPVRKLLDDTVELSSPDPSTRMAAIERLETNPLLSSSQRLELENTKRLTEFELSTPVGVSPQTHAQNIIKAANQLETGKLTPENIIVPDNPFRQIAIDAENGTPISLADLRQRFGPIPEIDTRIQAFTNDGADPLTPMQREIISELETLQALVAKTDDQSRQAAEDLYTAVAAKVDALPIEQQGIFTRTDDAVASNRIRVSAKPEEQQIVNDYIRTRADEPMPDAEQFVQHYSNLVETRRALVDDVIANKSVFDEQKLAEEFTVTDVDKSVQERLVSTHGDELVDMPDGTTVTVRQFLDDLDGELDELNDTLACLLS